MTKIISAIIAVYALIGTCMAGDFEITDEDHTTVSVHYTGTVSDWDVYRWNEVAAYSGERVVILTT